MLAPVRRVCVFSRRDFRISGTAFGFPGTFVLDVPAYPAFGVRTTSTDTVQPKNTYRCHLSRQPAELHSRQLRRACATPCGAATNTGCAIFVTGTVSCCVRTGGRGEEALAPAGTPVGFAVTCTGAACASRSRADAMRDASAEAVRLRERVRELEARLRHAQRGRSVHPFGRASGCGPEETLCSAGCGMRHSKSTGPPLPRLGSKKKWTCNVCEPTVCLKRDPLLQRHVMPAGPHRGHVLS